MQLELFSYDELKECYAKTCLALCREATFFLKRLDCRFQYVIDCYSRSVDSFHAFYFSRRK